MRVRPLVPLMLVVCLSPARAGKWPVPALGESSSGGPEVLFTFDDGPDDRLTGKVLDTLAAHGARAVFFLVGRHFKSDKTRAQSEALVARMIEERHVPGNHTIDHVHLCAVAKDKAERQIDENRKILEAAAGMPVGLFRAPYGNHCKRLVEQLGARGIPHVHWDIDPQEWKSHDAKRTRDYVIGKLKRLDGRAVILMHDIHPATVKALPEILAWIDEENARRREKGGKDIRVMDPSELGGIELDPGMAATLDDLAKTANELGPGLVRAVLEPFAGAPQAPAPPRSAAL